MIISRAQIHSLQDFMLKLWDAGYAVIKDMGYNITDRNIRFLESLFVFVGLIRIAKAAFWVLIGVGSVFSIVFLVSAVLVRIHWPLWTQLRATC